jgi:excinuclease ABC subunit A
MPIVEKYGKKMLSKIIIRGAKEHNLKSVNLDLPRNNLIVFTGLSGSGKSSLAFDTIYAEGQRRYVESLSAYARQFLELMQKPDVESIEGLSPAISIEQKTTSKNPRSTVGTVTEVYDYLRLLFARVGIPYSPTTGNPITSQTVTQIVDQINSMKKESQLFLLSPIVRGRKGEYKKELEDLQKRGFQRVKIDGSVYDLDDIPALNKKIKHNIEVVVDRIVLRDEIRTRLADSVETAVNLSEGLIFVENQTTGKIINFSTKFSCPDTGFTIDEIEPRLFSFNNPFGACVECDGLGEESEFDMDLIIPNENLSILEGAIKPLLLRVKTSHSFYMQTLENIAKHYNFNLRTPWKSLNTKIKKIILFGSGDEKINFNYNLDEDQFNSKKSFDGILPILEKKFETGDAWMKEDLNKFRSSRPCKACQGQRLKPEALCIKINGKNITEVSNLSIGKAVNWFKELEDKFTNKEKEIARRILKEIKYRLKFLINVGLEYLTLSRGSGTLSGGEGQRIRLASQIGSGLTGVLYVLDEPSIGLHQRDNKRLLNTLSNLRDLGNTVIVVEHDEEAILSADYIVDMGPGAGIHGGQVVVAGTPKQVFNNKNSITGQYITGVKKIDIPGNRRKGKIGQSIKISGAKANNLKNLNLVFPLGVLTCVTGVSGSGKSTLVINTMYKGLARIINGSREHPGEHTSMEGWKFLDKVIDIDQSPIGRTPRSNPATYTGLFTPIRDWFAGLPEAKSRGYKPGRFSFNVKGGRCEACEGDGVIKIEMHFLPDVYVQCDECSGKRYNRETLEIKYKSKSIADILEMTVTESMDFFKPIPSIRSKLETLQNVGLNYIHLGQAATTLSGGEAQRIKLSKELSKRSTGKTLYILDEPTTGLHQHDVKKLLAVLHTLVDQGNTVVIIEHNLDVIKTADWVIDLGPEGGEKGGKIVGCGTPEEVSNIKTSYTGEYLKKILTKKTRIERTA